MKPSKAELLEALKGLMTSENEDERAHCFQVLRAGLRHLPEEPAPSSASDDHIAGVGKMVEPVGVTLNYKDACMIAVWLGVQIPERGEFRDVYDRLSAAIGERG